MHQEDVEGVANDQRMQFWDLPRKIVAQKNLDFPTSNTIQYLKVFNHLMIYLMSL